MDEQSSLVPREEEAAASWEQLRAVSDCHLVAKLNFNLCSSSSFSSSFPYPSPPPCLLPILLSH